MGGPVTQDPSVLQCPSSSGRVPGCRACSSLDCWQLRLAHSSSGGLWLQWCPTVMVCDLSGAVSRQVSQTQQHQEALPQGDSGDLLPCLTDTLTAAQLLCKQSWDWGLFLFIPLHKILKFEKNKTHTNIRKAPNTQRCFQRKIFPICSCWAGLLSLCPMVQCCPFWGLLFLGRTWMQEPVQIRGLLSLVHGPLTRLLQSKYMQIHWLYPLSLEELSGACCATKDWFLSHPAVSPKSCRDTCQYEPH